MTRPRAPRARGQATVELALGLPFVAATLLLVVQVGLVVHAQILVVHAAREAARAAAVGRAPPPPDGLDASGWAVRVETGDDGRVTAVASYRAPTDVPIVGSLVPDVVLHAEAAMRDERRAAAPP